MIYQISYDLRSATADYLAVYEKIKSFGVSLPILKSTWLVSTEKDSDMMTDELQTVIQKGDRFFISAVVGDQYNGWHATSTWEWINLHKNTMSNEGIPNGCTSAPL